MPEGGAAFQVAQVVRPRRGAAADSAHVGKYPEPEEHVDQVDAGEDEVVHEEVVRCRGDAGAEFLAPFKDFVDDEANAAEQAEQEVKLHIAAAAGAEFFNAGGDKPGGGDQQDGVGEAEPWVEQGAGLGEDLHLLALREGEDGEEDGEHHHVAEDQNPDACFARQVPPGRFRDGGQVLR